MNRPEAMVLPELREETRDVRRTRHPREKAVRRVAHPRPAFHATVARPIDGMPQGWTARVLVLRRADETIEIYHPLIAYQIAHPNRSATWQNDVVRGVGLFWDYSMATAMGMMPNAPDGGNAFLDGLLQGFAQALRAGTAASRRDPSGLYWQGSTRSVATKLVRRIEDFARWCQSRSLKDRYVDGPTRAPEDGLGFTDILVWSRMRKLSMLDYIEVEPKKIRRESVVDRERDPRGHGLESVKFFPRASAERLIWEGHRRPKAAGGGDAYGVHNIRDQMMALLDGWGGLRRSEGLHLWVRDVIQHPDKPGHAMVVLRHPTDGPAEYRDQISGRMKAGTRAQVLNEVFGLPARNGAKRGRYHVGWKGMDLDRSHIAIVIWLDDRAAALFWALYLAYIRHVRTPIMERRKALGGYDHPFLFVSEGRDGNADGKSRPGDPYSMQAYERNHKAAVLRIGLRYGKEYGTTTHGLRHMFGRSLADLKVAPEIIRKAMRHVSVLSQLVYVAPDNATTDACLREAWGRLDTGATRLPAGTGPVNAPLDDEALSANTIEALLHLRNMIMDGGSVA